ncbi:MAG: ketopantoate reductase family protein [Candidatus Omnitrophica bacterium]|nr:ketopantoate reductase family protein [Candidatus Omnitrophota bacterium]
MKIAVIGAGAIGCLVAGYLKLKDEDVYLVGRSEVVRAIKKEGLKISGVRGDFRISLPVYERLNSQKELVILATKTQDVEQAIKENLIFLKNTPILTTQNGIQADEIVARYIPKEEIISSIIMFAATYLQPGKIVHNFEGNWIMGRPFNGDSDEKIISLSLVLNKIFPLQITPEIQGMKYLKIFVNANNCIPAILGLSMQEAFKDLEISRLGIAIWKEGFRIISQLKIKLVSLPGFPVENLIKLISLDSDEAARIFSAMMLNLSKEPLYGSILQSIKRQRPSEIDYINGEFVRLAKENDLNAPLNERLVEMVHQVEKNRRFLSRDELITATRRLIN